MATVEERLTALENFFQLRTNPHTGEAYCITRGRLGVMTEFWSRMPQGQGAALSVGSDVDRYALYVELEAGPQVAGDRTAILARCDAINPAGINRAVEAIANNASGNVCLKLEGQGLEVTPSHLKIVIGKIGGALKQLWP